MGTNRILRVVVFLELRMAKVFQSIEMENLTDRSILTESMILSLLI